MIYESLGIDSIYSMRSQPFELLDGVGRPFASGRLVLYIHLGRPSPFMIL